MLAAWNNVVGRQPWHQRWYPAVNTAAAAAGLAAAAASGLTAADLGLTRERLPAGLRYGAAPAAAVAAGWLAAAAMPAAQPVLRDERLAAQTGREAAYHALVRIPAGTVLWEEVAFRGVLQATLRRVLPEGAAIAVASGMFGIWHIRPTLEALRVNQLAGGRRATGNAVAAAVAATAAGGAVLALLRARSGSLAAPVLLHLATNSPGPLLAWACRQGRRGTGQRPLRTGHRPLAEDLPDPA